MNNIGRTFVFVFAILFVIAGLRMAFAMTQPYIASVPVVGDTAAKAVNYLLA